MHSECLSKYRNRLALFVSRPFCMTYALLEVIHLLQLVCAAISSCRHSNTLKVTSLVTGCCYISTLLLLHTVIVQTVGSMVYKTCLRCNGTICWVMKVYATIWRHSYITAMQSRINDVNKLLEVGQHVFWAWQHFELVSENAVWVSINCCNTGTSSSRIYHWILFK